MRSRWGGMCCWVFEGWPCCDEDHALKAGGERGWSRRAHLTDKVGDQTIAFASASSSRSLPHLSDISDYELRNSTSSACTVDFCELAKMSDWRARFEWRSNLRTPATTNRLESAPAPNNARPVAVNILGMVGTSFVANGLLAAGCSLLRAWLGDSCCTFSLPQDASLHGT